MAWLGNPDCGLTVVPRQQFWIGIAAIVRDQRSSLIALVFRLASAVMLFGVVVTLARVLGPEGFGIYAFVFALMQVSVNIGRGGLPNMLVRDLALANADDDGGARRRILELGWLVAAPLALLAAAIFAWVLLPVFSRDMDVPNGAAIFGGLYIGAMILVGMVEAALRGSGSILIGQAGELLVRPGVHLTIIGFAAIGLSTQAIDPAWALGAAMFSGLSALVFCFVAYVRVFKNLARTKRAPRQPAFFVSLVTLSGSVWVAALNTYVNVIMLGMIGSEAEAGIFQIAVQLTALMTLGLMAANASMAPEMSRLMAVAHEREGSRLQSLASRSCEISLVFGLPLAAIYVLFGDELIPSIFGAPFSNAYLPTVILAVGQLVNIGFGSIGTLLFCSRQEHVVLKAMSVATFSNVVLCVILIPAFGANGAAIASVVSLAIWNGMSFVRLKASNGISSLPLIPQIRRIARRAQEC